MNLIRFLILLLNFHLITSSESITIPTLVPLEDVNNVTEKIQSYSYKQSGSKQNAKFYNKTIPKKFIIDSIPIPNDDALEWQCINLTATKSLECSCDLPYTLRCSADIHGLLTIADKLRESPYKISFFDCSLKNVTVLNDNIFKDVSIHGLVISSGEIKLVHKSAFFGFKDALKTLGLPNNALENVPWNSISQIQSLERLDLSNNKIKSINSKDFIKLQNLDFLDLSFNSISIITPRSFINQNRLSTLKLSGNHLGGFSSSLLAISLCVSLRQLDLSSNYISGNLNSNDLPTLRKLEILNLEKNLIKSIQNKAFENYSKLTSLSLNHNQIDVLQDNAFYGLMLLENLDLSYNGIVSISSASLQHLFRLKTLDLRHNFLRALTSDLMSSLKSLTSLQLSGNDISIVSDNALSAAKNLRELTMDDNPLSCDCSIVSFAIWLNSSKLSQKDLLSPVCATPPHYEAAPLTQISISSLTCNQDSIEMDYFGEMATKNANLWREKNDKIYLKEFHYSADYGLILTWNLDLKKNYLCKEILVYDNNDNHKMLLDQSPIHCESKFLNDQNTVTVILPSTIPLTIGQSYRFCLVIENDRDQTESMIGCSNITKIQLEKAISNRNLTTYKFEQQIIKNNQNIGLNGSENLKKSTILNNIDRNLITGFGLIILLAGIFVLFWGAMKVHADLNIPNSPICYTHSTETYPIEIGNRYLKLQATSTV